MDNAQKKYRNKITLFWVVAPCNALMMETAGTCETSVNVYHTTRRYNPADSLLYTCCFENLKSYLIA
jgi:hypothetical protein